MVLTPLVAACVTADESTEVVDKAGEVVDESTDAPPTGSPATVEASELV